MAEQRERDLQRGETGRATRATSWVALPVALMLVLPAAPAAAQGTGGPGDIPAAGQYVEQIPSSARPTRGKVRGKALPKGVRDRLRSQPDATSRELETLATDPSLGAPVEGGTAAPPRRRSTPRNRLESGQEGSSETGGASPSGAGSAKPPAGPAEPTSISAADPGTISSTGLGSPVLILGVLIALTGAALVARRVTGRKSRPDSASS